MNKNEAKRFLESHFFVSKKIIALEIEVKELKASDKFDAAYLLEQEVEKLSQRKEQVREAIKLLDDADIESILIMRYINHKTIEKTAEELNYAPRTVRCKTKKGIEKLCLILP